LVTTKSPRAAPHRSRAVEWLLDAGLYSCINGPVCTARTVMTDAIPPSRWAMSRNRAVLLAGAALVVAAILYIVFAGRPAKELTLYGNVDIRAVTVGFRVAGRLATLDVDEGDPVHAGQRLARLDSTPLALEVDEARANAAAIGKRMELLKSGYRPEEIAVARATVEERRATLLNAEQTLARQLELKGTGAVAPRVYDDAVAARDAARALLGAALQTLKEQVHGYRPQEIAEGEGNHARADAITAEAEQRLADTVLNAPADGVVLTRAVESGAILPAGTPVFTISLRTPVWARIYVSEPDLGQVAPGREVLLDTDARPGRPYHGHIGFVSTTAEFTPKNVETPELRTALVYRARVVVRDADSQLRQGMPVTVRLAPAGGDAPDRGGAAAPP
jgi:HlyD family secretion protein